MKLNRFRFLIIAILIISTSGALFAQLEKSELPDYIKDQIHKDITYTVINKNNLDKIDELDKGLKEHHFVVVQVPPEDFTQEYADKLLAWVKKGGILWFYDSRLAPFFGMENSPLNKKDFKGKAQKGDYGTGKVDGSAIIAYRVPLADHDVVSGVNSIQLFVMEVGEDEFSAVSTKTEGVIPLFVTNQQPKALIALRKYDNGWVVFKHLLWPSVYGGERFQVNLKEFSGGYPVPKGEKPVIKPEALRGKPVKLRRYDSVKLSDGQQVIGMVKDKSFDFMGDRGTMTKKIKEIDSIRFHPTGTEVTFTDGTTFTGPVLTMSIKFETITGKTIRIEKENLVRIRFNVQREQ